MARNVSHVHTTYVRSTNVQALRAACSIRVSDKGKLLAPPAWNHGKETCVRKINLFGASCSQEIYTAFTQYKFKIPTAGALLLNASCTKVLLVRSWYGKLWGFPKGKIDCDEDMPSCARREVLEEVGYDISDKLDPDAYVELQLKQYPTLRLYIIRGVDEDFDFITQTKKEISAIEWFKIKDIPLGKDAAQDGSRKKGFGMVAPYIIKLKQWLTEHKKAATDARKDGKRAVASSEVQKTSTVKAVAVAAPAGMPARRKAAQATWSESQVRVLQAQPRKERKGHPFLDFTFTTRRVLSALDVAA
uniref:Nudix hydrolase domain-containing protein n=1 Tax=Chrysotila carterae TaxID=13221 RepID=A0A7S4C2H2_CHRCT|mmetsp:Transcript_7217/g.16001  ORF Transcript_7217/g.16001 Transcript_7217/m.16001 type:complete len:303 (-) Transcript_7217:458-1366(-)